MQIIIAGAGTVGLDLASKLSGEGHDLFLIDRRNNQLRSAEEQLDIKTVVGDATDLEILRQASTGEADLVIAVTDNDATNVMVCQLASRLGARKRIARIRESRCFADPSVLIPADMGIDMVIFPEYQTAREILNLLSHPYATDVSSFFHNQMELVGVDIVANSPLVHKTLPEIAHLTKKSFRIVGVIRGEEAIIPVNWSETVEARDKVFIVSAAEDTERIVKDFGFPRATARKVFIFGGTSIGFNVAKSLESSRLQVRVLEPSRERSKEMAFDLKKAMILHGEGTDTSLLEGEGISEADVFVAVTENEELNMLSCLLAKRMGAKKCIALVTKPDYVSLISTLGIDGFVSRRMMTINRILQFVRRGEVVSVAELREDKIEAIEFRVTKNSILDGMCVGSSQFQQVFPDSAVIGGIQAPDGQSYVPDNRTVLSTGDRVMVYSNAEKVLELEKLFV